MKGSSYIANDMEIKVDRNLMSNVMSGDNHSSAGGDGRGEKIQVIEDDDDENTTAYIRVTDGGEYMLYN